MTGYLAAAGTCASEGRVGDVLRNIHQPYHEARCQVGFIKCCLIILFPQFERSLEQRNKKMPDTS